MKEPSNYKNTIKEELSSFFNSNKLNFTSLFDKLYNYSYKDYKEDYSVFSSFIREQSDIYFNKAINEYKKTERNELKKELTQIALNEYHKRYDVLIQLGDSENFEYVLNKAKDFLKGGDYLFFKGDRFESGQVIFDLLKAYYNPPFKEAVTAFILEAFDFAKKYAFENKEYEYLSGEPDGSTLLVIAQAISSLNKEDREKFTTLVFDIYTYCSFVERSYELHQTSGYIALLLTMYDKKIDIKILDNAINNTGKYYQDNTFVHQTLYCKWVLTNDSKSALSYLKSEGKRKGFIFATIALADLNYKEALPFFELKLKNEKEPIFVEVIKEAIERLNVQNTIPKIENRMIWLNGNLTPTQRALGTENDNVFVKRAKKKIEYDDNVYETDDD